MPDKLIDALLPFASFVRHGKAAQLHHTVEHVIGRMPLTFAGWAQENAGSIY